MIKNVLEIVKSRDMVIPRLLFKNYKLLKIDDRELIFIIYVINESGIFNPKQISIDLNIGVGEVMDIVNDLIEKKLIKLELKKVNNKRNEFIILDNLFEKLILLNTKEEKKETTNIFDIFEKEFGRTLSPMEYEIINAWLDKLSEEIIIMALKEATYNGVSNLKYIDRILSSWEKKGIKTKEDVEKDNKKFNNVSNIKIEDFDYDWLNSNE